MSEIEKMFELRISNDLSLPKEAVTWVFAYVAKRGAGKTYNAAVQAEEMLKAGIPIGVIDGMGIWWGLRSSADGKGTGLPIVVFGGEHADLPLVPERSTEMAKAIVESNISFVLDLSGFSKTLMRKIVQAFLDELYRINRVERHVFIEESDMFAPQKPFGPEAIMCLSAVDNFIRRGGNHNLGCTLITQRSAVLNKDLLTQADCLVILRTLAPQDKEAIQAWVKEQTEEDKEKLKVFYDSLKDLENGEAWVWHPEKPSIYCRVKFRQRETFHATREFILNPQAAEIKLMNVGEFVSKFKRIFEQDQVSPVNASMHNVDAQQFKGLQAEVDALRIKVEEFRSGRKLPGVVKQKIELLEADKKNLQKMVDDGNKAHNDMCQELFELHEKLTPFENFVKAFAAILPVSASAGVPALGKEEISALLGLEAKKMVEEFKKVAEDAAKREMVKFAAQDGAAAVTVTEIIPEIHHKIDRPIVQSDETTREGQMLTVVLHGFFDEKKRLNEIAKEMQRLYLFAAGNAARDLTPILGRLVTWKILQREEQSNGGWMYWLADGAKDRIKEAA